jgi:hypothetical protein
MQMKNKWDLKLHSWYAHLVNLYFCNHKKTDLRTNKELLLKGVKYLAYTTALLFTAPVVLYQAFKNQEHPWYIPVLILGGILAISAIVMGFYSIKTIIDALFGKKSDVKN